MSTRQDPLADLVTYAYRYFPGMPLRQPSSAPRRPLSRRHGVLLAAVLLGAVFLTARGGVEAQASSEEGLRASGMLVEVRTVTRGAGGIELHGLRLVHRQQGIEVWADVARLGVDLETLRHLDGKDLPLRLEGVRVTMPDGRVFESRLMSVTRQADGKVTTRGQVRLAGRDQLVDWYAAWSTDLDLASALPGALDQVAAES